MTAPRRTLHLADSGQAADLAAFLARLIHYDRAAAVRMQASGTKLAVFGRPASFEVLAVRAALLAKPYEHGLDASLDVTVSAGELLESVDERAATAGVPAAVTGPPWAGLLPPRGGWRPEPGLPRPKALRQLVAGAVAEFRARTKALPAELRTRDELDRIGQEIWSRPIAGTPLPFRAAHAAQILGFLPASRQPTARDAADGDQDVYRTPLAVTGRRAATTAEPRRSVSHGEGPRTATHAPDGTRIDADPENSEDVVTLVVAGPWLRLRTAYGSIAVRRAGLGVLDVTPA